MSSGPLAVRAALAVVLFAFTALPAVAQADQKKPKPSADELLQAYPLEPTATATAAHATATATPRATATPAPSGGGGAPVLPIALALLVAGAAGGVVLMVRRRPRPAPAVVAPAPNRAAERLRDAVDISRSREWPWPAGAEDLWRCEVSPDAASLSAQFRAVVHPPGGAPPVVIAESTAAPANAGDWQSAAPLEQAVAALARQLEAQGWEPIDTGRDPQVRRFCRRTRPHLETQEAAWTAHQS
jgi:hypothetical protein